MEPPTSGPAPDRDAPADDDRRARTLLALSDLTRELDDPLAIVAQAMRLLREALAADRCAWAELEADSRHFAFLGCDCAPGVPEVSGRWPVSAFGPVALREMREGRSVVLADTLDGLPEGPERAGCEATGIRALIGVPLCRRGRLVAGTGVHAVAPRAWSAADVALAEEVTQRCREAVERARAAIALARRTRELESRQQRLTLALMVGRSGTFEWDAVADRIVWDDELLALYGLTPAHLDGGREAWLELVHPDDRERALAGVRRAIATGSWDDEFRIVRRDDARVRWMHARAQAFYDASGRLVRAVGINVDVTERKRAEQALRSSEAQFRAMADGVPLIVWVSDADGRNAFVNLQYCAWFGVSRDGALGRDWHVLGHPDDMPGHVRRFEEAVAAQAPYRGRIRACRTDGAWRLLEVVGVPRFDDEGTFVGHVGVASDVTDATASADGPTDAFLASLSGELRGTAPPPGSPGPRGPTPATGGDAGR